MIACIGALTPSRRPGYSPAPVIDLRWALEGARATRRSGTRWVACPLTVLQTAVEESKSDEANLPAESDSPEANPRVSRAYEDQGWESSLEAPPGEGSKTAGRRHAVEVAKAMRTGRFRRTDRLLRNREYRYVARRGRRAVGEGFVVLVVGGSKTDRDTPRRLGVTMSRKVGGAVVRNRLKRQVRTWFRRSRARLSAGSEVVVIGRRSAAGQSSRKIESTLDELLITATRQR